MPKPKSFTLLFFLLSATLLPISDADIHRRSSKSSSSDDGVQAQALWCVAKNNADDSALQAAIDWACGAGGADCSPIQQGGPCYDASNIQNMASYAFNDYFLKHGLSDDSCNFNNNAAIISINPSTGNCKFPSSSSAASNGSFSGSISSPDGSSSSMPSADMSGCSEVGGRWFWALITSHLLLILHPTVLG